MKLTKTQLRLDKLPSEIWKLIDIATKSDLEGKEYQEVVTKLAEILSIIETPRVKKINRLVKKNLINYN
jgi:hypothetical protein